MLREKLRLLLFSFLLADFTYAIIETYLKGGSIMILAGFITIVVIMIVEIEQVFEVIIQKIIKRATAH